MRIGDFLLGVAGADCESMRTLPHHERRKYVGIGAILILTSIVAALSFGYATSTVVHEYEHSLLITIIGGLIWGAAILIIDRHLIISISSKPSWSTRFISVLVRVALATMVAGAVSIPVELMIFKDRLERELFETQLQLRGKDKTEIEHLHNVQGNKQEVEIKRIEVTELRQQLDKLPPHLTALDQKVKACRYEENALRARNTNKIPPLRTDLNKAKRERSSIVRTLRNISKSENWEYEKQIKQHINRLNFTVSNLNSRIDSLQKELGAKTTECRRLANQLDTETGKHHNKIRERLAFAQADLENERASLNKARLTAQSDIERATNKTAQAYSANLIAQLEALWRLAKREKPIFWTYLATAMVFFLIEVAPLLLKLLSHGPYERFIDGENQKSIAELEVRTLQAIEKATTEGILIQAEEQAKRDYFLEKEMAVLREAIGVNVKFEKNFQEIIGPVMLAQRTIEALCEAQAARVHAENQHPDLSEEIGEISMEAYLKVISRAVRKMEPFEKPLEKPRASVA